MSLSLHSHALNPLVISCIRTLYGKMNWNSHAGRLLWIHYPQIYKGINGHVHSNVDFLITLNAMERDNCISAPSSSITLDLYALRDHTLLRIKADFLTNSTVFVTYHASVEVWYLLPKLFLECIIGHSFRYLGTPARPQGTPLKNLQWRRTGSSITQAVESSTKSILFLSFNLLLESNLFRQGIEENVVVCPNLAYFHRL